MQTQPHIPSELERLIKQYLDCLVKMNQQLLDPEDCSVIYYEILELTELLKGELMKQLFPTDLTFDMKLIKQSVELFSKFQTFCIEKKGLRGTLFDFVFDILNREIIVEYLTILKLSEEQQERKLPKVDGFVHQLCTTLVELWKEFRESEMIWKHEELYSINDITGTVHPTSNGAFPYYLGYIEANGKPVHVFMDCQSGQVFFMLSLDSFKQFESSFMAGVKEMTYSGETCLIDLIKEFFEKFGFSKEKEELYMPRILSFAQQFREISGKPCVSPIQTDQETHEKQQQNDWNKTRMELIEFFLSMTFN
jgi:hypothetical protein